MSQTYWWHTNTTMDSTSIPVQRSEMPGDGREIVHREVNFELEAEGDGRTLYTRIVPYNSPQRVCDPPHFIPYTEVWKPGVFDRQLRAANRVDVLLNFEHEKGIGGVVGRGVELHSEPDGLLGTFRLLNNQDGEKTRELVNEKVLTGMSLEALVLKSTRDDEGVISRTEARLRNVAICRTPAFPGAEVLAVRTEGDDPPEEPAPEDPPPPEPSPAIVVPELAVRDDITQLLERVGVVQLERREVVSSGWDPDTNRFEEEQYARSCLVDRGGEAPAKERCSLPVLEPTGELNLLALKYAAKQLPTLTGITPGQRAEVARQLVRLHRQVDLDIPAAVLDAARR